MSCQLTWGRGGGVEKRGFMFEVPQLAFFRVGRCHFVRMPLYWLVTFYSLLSYRVYYIKHRICCGYDVIDNEMVR